MKREESLSIVFTLFKRVNTNAGLSILDLRGKIVLFIQFLEHSVVR